jgi:HEPN domain-containing protein
LDRYYIPTRYPNGTPDAVPAQLYDAADSRETIQMAETVVTLVARKIEI